MTAVERLQRSGIRRKGTPRAGFRYALPGGRSPTAEQLARIRRLRLPPAWRDVAIDPSPAAKLQAVGRDRAGRWQYRYHPTFIARRNEEKYERLVAFANALPKMRRAIQRDLSRKDLGRERVLAVALRILSACFVRPGSSVYAEENGSFGLSTLRRRHVRVVGDLVVLDFPGKAGKVQHRELRDRRVARLLRRLLELPGDPVLRWVDPEGELVRVRRRDINAYIKGVMGEHFSAKDFRTWAGTLVCACALARAGVDAREPRAAKKKKVVQAVKETAEQLGNTPAIARASYIYPSVLSQFERGRVVEKYFHDVEEFVSQARGDFHATERALLRLLKHRAA